MALTAADVALWDTLTALGVIPACPRVLEIGEANWFGDMPPPEGCQDECAFNVARKFYKKVLNYARIMAVDLNGKTALPLDLNQPLPLDRDQVFDVIINSGTAEHVFDQRQLMQTIHERCTVGGLMVHAVPWKGWNNHGFYCFQPCFFADLARANHYALVHQSVWQSGQAAEPDVMAYMALRKVKDEPFRVPMQSRLGLM